MKRLILTLIAGTLLATALGGCIVAPAPGYYYGGGGYYHHGGYYYRYWPAARVRLERGARR